MSGAWAMVTGGTGFIGRHVCRELARRGIEVVGVGHGKSPDAERKEWGITRWYEGDVTLQALKDAMVRGKPVALIHCAGSGTVSFSYEAPLEDYRRSVHSTAEVLEFARTHCGRNVRVVLVSSAAVYGDQGDVNLTESHPCAPVSPYGFSKLAAENLCVAYSRFFQIKVSVVRLFSVFGEGLRKQLLWDALCKFAKGDNRFLGTGREIRDWIHVDDAAALLSEAAVADQRPFEIYNGGHTKATTRDVLERVARLFGSSLQPEFSGEMHPGNPERLTSDSRQASERLRWAARVGLDRGLARYVRWFASEANR